MGRAFFGQSEGSILASNFGCTGTEPSLLSCPYGTGQSCFHSEDAGVICPTQDPSQCAPGVLRLVGGSNQYEGRVELCLHGRWGTVCDDIWNGYNAAVVCRRLGFTENGYAFAASQASFGPGSGFILLDEVDCEGDEASLLECRSRSTGEHDCSPSEDAGVVCPSMCN